jgi:16S rRNA (cytosine967-C5)-methyltransferase
MSAHASVNETVNLATRARGFINAILRRADRERAKLLAAVDQLPPPIRWSHPGPLVERLATFLPEADVLALLEWDQRPAETYVRVNGLHPDASQMSEMKEGWTPVGDGFFRCQSAPRGELAAGLCYAQDPSTALAVTLLDPKSGELILDACAAPGGKTALMAQMMKNQGLIVATDSSAARLKRLAGNLARMRVTNVNAALHDWASATHPEGAVAGKFDAILLDAPCSNTGVMRRRVDVRWRLDAAAFTAQAASQLALLKSVLRVLKPGGRLVYSTCSIDPEENTGVVDKLLQAHPDVKRLDERQTMPQKDGIDGAYAVLLRRG